MPNRDLQGVAYRVSRGDILDQDVVFHPSTIREILDGLATYAGELAYSPTIQAKVNQALMRRFNTDEGNDIFTAPHYGVYADPQMAAFYGVSTQFTDNMQTRWESIPERKDRIIQEVIREVEMEIPVVLQDMEHYRIESWARHGIADETPLIHTDPDITLFRNPDHQWAAVDNPIATSQKTNCIDLYQASPEFTFPTPHPGWEVDRQGGFWNSLPTH